jgi:D-alanyl-lipoteichoic acid acyltransferase DltB (MBOAT superfamily)
LLFNSVQFIFHFLPIALAGFFLAGRWSARAAAVWLCAASFAFYAWWPGKMVVLLAASVAVNYFLASRIHGAAEHRDRRRWMWAGIVANLSVLGWFKYAGFFASIFTGEPVKLAETAIRWASPSTRSRRLHTWSTPPAAATRDCTRCTTRCSSPSIRT